MADPVTLSLASAGLTAASGAAQGMGMSASYKQKESQAKRLEFASRTAADQTDAQFREELDKTIGNIEAIRAAAGVSGNSPTSDAIREGEEKASDRQRRIKVGNLLSQADQSAGDASYYSSAAGTALGLGALQGLAGGFNRLAGVPT